MTKSNISVSLNRGFRGFHFPTPRQKTFLKTPEPGIAGGSGIYLDPPDRGLHFPKTHVGAEENTPRTPRTPRLAWHAKSGRPRHHDIVRAPLGLTSGLDPNYEVQIDAGNRLSWIVSYSEGQAPMLFNSNAPPPGDQVASLFVRLSASLPQNTVVHLRLVGGTTALGNQQGTIVETAANGRLALVSGELGMPSIFADGFESGDTSAW